MSLTTEDKESIKDIVVAVVAPLLAATERRLETKLASKIETTEAKLTDKIDVTDAKLSGKVASVDAKLGGKIDRLADKVASNHSVNIQHHLATRAMMAKQGKKYDLWREGLALAVTGKNAL